MNRDRRRARCSWRRQRRGRKIKADKRKRWREVEREKECVRDGWTTRQRERLNERPGGEAEEYGRRVCVKWEGNVCERKSERGTKNEAWLHDWVSLTVGHTRESVLQTLLVITPSRQLSVLCSNASGLVASRASQQNRSNASLWNSDGSRKRFFVFLDRNHVRSRRTRSSGGAPRANSPLKHTNESLEDRSERYVYDPGDDCLAQRSNRVSIHLFDAQW